jgi:hypothetical protein|tara:strand:- start:69535 stop:69918 length:384 start_codon:yes stop_codon:yes gene_type:complete
MSEGKKTISQICLLSATAIATLSAPVVMACAAIGGVASYKAGKAYGQKKYGGRDIGGAMPIAMICLGSGAAGALGAGYIGANVSEAFSDSASSFNALTAPVAAQNLQAQQDLENTFSKHFVHSFAAK